MPTVLALLGDGFEEIETVTPIDLLRRAGVDVIVAAVAHDQRVVGRSGLTLVADKLLAEITTPLFDCLFLPGGPGVKHLRASVQVLDLVRAHHAADRWIAAICAAPTVLHDAGLLEHRRYTAHFSVASELPRILDDQRVVIDGKILTSRGAGTALDFGIALVEQLTNPSIAAELKKSICA